MRFAVIGIVAYLGSVVVGAQDAGTPVHAGTPGVSHPRLRSAAPIDYPSTARSAMVSGTVIIDVITDDTGVVSTATIAKSIPLLDDAALDAVRRWRFDQPGAGAIPFRFATTVTVHFRLSRETAPLPSFGILPSNSGIPADFVVVYSYGCPTGTKSGHVFEVSEAPIVATLTTATHQLEPVYRAMSEAALLTRTEGLIVWDEPPADRRPIVSNDGVVVTVTERRPSFVCSDRVGASTYALAVRSSGKWRRLWPPVQPGAVPRDYEAQLGPIRALLQRVVAGN